MVPDAHTVVGPGTVMIHLELAPTQMAMGGSDGFELAPIPLTRLIIHVKVAVVGRHVDFALGHDRVGRVSVGDPDALVVGHYPQNVHAQDEGIVQVVVVVVQLVVEEEQLEEHHAGGERADQGQHAQVEVVGHPIFGKFIYVYRPRRALNYRRLPQAPRSTGSGCP